MAHVASRSLQIGSLFVVGSVERKTKAVVVVGLVHLRVYFAIVSRGMMAKGLALTVYGCRRDGVFILPLGHVEF